MSTASRSIPNYSAIPYIARQSKLGISTKQKECFVHETKMGNRITDTDDAA